MLPGDSYHQIREGENYAQDSNHHNCSLSALGKICDNRLRECGPFPVTRLNSLRGCKEHSSIQVIEQLHRFSGFNINIEYSIVMIEMIDYISHTALFGVRGG